ncbi:hypothetical protein M5K25_001482 [Dendrobium thyrsiflorum]|uniref:Uncharacterized protein n=1 Tax=Dendrobium thyrsiflorum TaxID=117978 RepID=A0ABD0VQL3_DENTH
MRNGKAHESSTILDRSGLNYEQDSSSNTCILASEEPKILNFLRSSNSCMASMKFYTLNFFTMEKIRVILITASSWKRKCNMRNRKAHESSTILDQSGLNYEQDSSSNTFILASEEPKILNFSRSSNSCMASMKFYTLNFFTMEKIRIILITASSWKRKCNKWGINLADCSGARLGLKQRYSVVRISAAAATPHSPRTRRQTRLMGKLQKAPSEAEAVAGGDEEEEPPASKLLLDFFFLVGVSPSSTPPEPSASFLFISLGDDADFFMARALNNEPM